MARETWTGASTASTVIGTQIPANEDRYEATKTEVENARDGEATLLAQIDSLQALIAANTPTSGTYAATLSSSRYNIVMDTSYDTLGYYKIGKFVNVFGRIKIATATYNAGGSAGPMTLNVPFESMAATSEDSDIAYVNAITAKVIAVPSSLFFTITPGTSLIRTPIDIGTESSTYAPEDNQAFGFNFSYIAA